MIYSYHELANWLIKHSGIARNELYPFGSTLPHIESCKGLELSYVMSDGSTPQYANFVGFEKTGEIIVNGGCCEEGPETIDVDQLLGQSMITLWLRAAYECPLEAFGDLDAQGAEVEFIRAMYEDELERLIKNAAGHIPLLKGRYYARDSEEGDMEDIPFDQTGLRWDDVDWVDVAIGAPPPEHDSATAVIPDAAKWQRLMCAYPSELRDFCNRVIDGEPVNVAFKQTFDTSTNG